MRKGKFNILDAFIIVFVLALLCVAAYKFIGKDNFRKSGDYKEVTYVIKVQGLRDFSAESILQKGELFLNDDAAEMGTIVKREIVPSKSEIRKTTGETVLVDVPERYDVYITVKSEGVHKDNGFFLYGKTGINIGNEKSYKCGHVVFSGTIIEINS